MDLLLIVSIGLILIGVVFLITGEAEDFAAALIFIMCCALGVIGFLLVLGVSIVQVIS